MITETMKAKAKYARLRKEAPSGDRQRQEALTAWYGAMAAEGLTIDERDAELKALID